MVTEWRVGYSDSSGSGEYGEGVYITSGNLPIVRGGLDNWGCAVGVIDPRHAPIIAAAPDLLAALEMIVRRLRMYMDDGGRPDYYSMQAMLEKAEPAIKKAKGD